MRIAQLAPPWITVPPAGYGGTEWVVQQLCDGLVARGHDVRLYATGDSHTAAELCALFPEQMPDRIGVTPYDARQVSFAFADIEASGFDLVHDHSGFLGVAFSRYLATPMVHTVHCAFDEVAYGFYEQFAREVGYICISEYQRSMAPPGMNWAGLAYNAIAVEQWPYTPEKDDYLLAFGRVCEAKGFHHSIEAAKRLDRRLIMAGVLQEPYREYFEEHGRAAHRRRPDRVRGRGERRAQARAVRARARVPLPHHVAGAVRAGDDRGHGLRHPGGGACARARCPRSWTTASPGSSCDDFDDFVAAVGRVGEIDPAVCRRTVEQRFTVERMVADYEAIYGRYLGSVNERRRTPAGDAA